MLTLSGGYLRNAALLRAVAVLRTAVKSPEAGPEISTARPSQDRRPNLRGRRRCLLRLPRRQITRARATRPRAPLAHRLAEDICRRLPPDVGEPNVARSVLDEQRARDGLRGAALLRALPWASVFAPPGAAADLVATRRATLRPAALGLDPRADVFVLVIPRRLAVQSSARAKGCAALTPSTVPSLRRRRRRRRQKVEPGGRRGRGGGRSGLTRMREHFADARA